MLDAISAALPRSIVPAWARSSVAGKAAIDSLALNPAIDKNFKADAASVAVYIVVAPIFLARSDISCNVLPVAPLIASTLDISKPKFAIVFIVPVTVLIAAAIPKNPAERAEALPIIPVKELPRPPIFVLAPVALVPMFVRFALT